MSPQKTMFPPTEIELRIADARKALEFAESEVERRDKAVVAAHEKLDNAWSNAAGCRRVLEYLTHEPVTVVIDPALTGDQEDDTNIEDVEVLETDGVAVTEDGVEYQTATGEVIDDTAEDIPGADEGHILVIWPDMEDAVESEVGPLTRYAELIHDGLQVGEDAGGFNVVGPIEVVDGEEVGEMCDPADVIPRQQWGLTFRVVAAS